MAIGDIVSDADLNAMAPVTTEAPPATFSDAEIAAMEDQSKAASDINAAYKATAPASPLDGPASPYPYAPTGLGPTQPKTFSTQELDHLEADSLNDPSVDLTRDQWDSAQVARKRVGGSFLGSALSNISGGIGGLIQTAYGGIKDLMHYPQYNGDFGDYAVKTLEHETGVANSALQGIRNAGMQTMLGIQQAKQGYQGLVDGSADAGLANATPDQIKAGADAGYGNYLDNNAFKREIEHPTITSVPQIVSMAAPDDASGQPVQQALAASFNNPATAPLKDLTDLSAMVAAPENQIAGAAGALISKVPIGNMVKYASGRVLQGLGNTTIVANDALDSVAKAAIDRVNAVIPSVKIGDKVYEGADIAAAGVVGGAGLLGWSGASHGEEGGNPLWSAMKPVLGYLALRKGAAVVRTIGQGAQVTGTILREASDVMGPLRQDALGAIASNPAIPEAYRTAAGDAVATGGTGAIDSTMSRVANSSDYPAWVRRVAAKANNPILTSAVRGAGSAVEGGIGGSLAMIPLTIGQDDDQAGANVGAGFGFGAAGGLASRVLGNSTRQRNQDVARFLADTQLAGGDVLKVAQLPAGRLQNLAAIQGLLSLKGTDVIPVGAAEFDRQVGTTLANQPGIAPADVVPLDGTDFSANVAALGGRGAAGWFLDAAPGQRARVFINLDASHPAEIHEGLGHAILASNVMDGAQRSDARNFIQQLYGDTGIEARANEYAKRQVEAEEASLRQRAAAAGQPIPTFPPIEDRITQRVEQLSNNGLAAGDEHPLDWARDEVFAEHMNQSGIDVNSIRKGLPANVDPDAATRSILAMNARSLAAQGVSIDPQTGKVNGSLSSIFRDNPLVGSSPTLSKQLARYVSSYDSWINGIDLGAKRVEGTQIAPSGSPYDMARSNLVNLRPVPGRPGVFENDFLRNDNGTVTFKSQDEIKRTDQLRKDQLSAAVGTSLRSKNDPILGPRMVDGKKVISGSQLPATMGALQHFGPWIQSIANTWRNDAGQGGIYRMKVNRVGTGESGSYKVINLGNIRSITRNFWEPFEYSVSKEGHLLAHTIDDSAVQRNVLKGINEGLLPYHNNDASAVRQSMMTYLSNHKQGLPSENGIGIGKRNEINALLTSFSKNHRSVNPLASNFGPQGVVRRLRMDRIEDMNRVVDQDKGSPTYGQPMAGFHFDYFKVNNNMMPDAPVGGNNGGMNSDYHGMHRPNPDGPPAHNLLDGDIAPADIYSHPHFTFDIGGNSEYQQASKESVAKLLHIRGKPDQPITIYRAAPKGSEINAGDWVSLSRKYAALHSRHPTDPTQDGPVISKQVMPSEVRWDGNDANEFGYFPIDSRKFDSSKSSTETKSNEQSHPQGDRRQSDPQASASAFYSSADQIDGGTSATASRDASRISQTKSLGSWALKNSRLIDPGQIESLPIVSNHTSEHEVRYRAEDGRAIKTTHPGVYGQIPVAINGGISKENATPAEYLRRMGLQNEIFQSDFNLEGVTIPTRKQMIIGEPEGQPSFVISQKWHPGQHSPKIEEIANRLDEDGFVPIKNSHFGWVRPSDRVVLIDAKPDNFIKDGDQIIPIDLQIKVFSPEEMQKSGLDKLMLKQK